MRTPPKKLAQSLWIFWEAESGSPSVAGTLRIRGVLWRRGFPGPQILELLRQAPNLVKCSFERMCPVHNLDPTAEKLVHPTLRRTDGGDWCSLDSVRLRLYECLRIVPTVARFEIWWPGSRLLEGLIIHLHVYAVSDSSWKTLLGVLSAARRTQLQIIHIKYSETVSQRPAPDVFAAFRELVASGMQHAIHTNPWTNQDAPGLGVMQTACLRKVGHRATSSSASGLSPHIRVRIKNPREVRPPEHLARRELRASREAAKQHLAPRAPGREQEKRVESRARSSTRSARNVSAGPGAPSSCRNSRTRRGRRSPSRLAEEGGPADGKLTYLVSTSPRLRTFRDGRRPREAPAKGCPQQIPDFCLKNPMFWRRLGLKNPMSDKGGQVHHPKTAHFRPFLCQNFRFPAPFARQSWSPTLDLLDLNWSSLLGQIGFKYLENYPFRA
ncbi:hypothetical protein B0H13DRAFT_2438550 [Mycena leptocephala]|nr:hypothetical protein B0H13DRAFT_2438550 [Mycena leptocephala]